MHSSSNVNIRPAVLMSRVCPHVNHKFSSISVKPRSIFMQNQRNYSSQSKSAIFDGFAKSMKSWEVNSYDGPRAMKLNEAAAIPSIGKHEVLVQIKASSVNPLDVMMTKGYGKEIFQVFRHLERGELSYDIDFPYTPGRDFAGIVVQAGSSVTNVREGDEVYGVLLFGHYGSHAEYTKTYEGLVRAMSQKKFRNFWNDRIWIWNVHDLMFIRF